MPSYELDLPGGDDCRQLSHDAVLMSQDADNKNADTDATQTCNIGAHDLAWQLRDLQLQLPSESISIYCPSEGAVDPDGVLGATKLKSSTKVLESSTDTSGIYVQRRPFRRWIKSLRKRSHRGRKGQMQDSDRLYSLHCTNSRPVKRFNFSNDCSSSGSSFAFVTAARSAGVSIYDQSQLTLPTVPLQAHLRPPVSHISSTHNIRSSEDSKRSGTTDSLALSRAQQRRYILEELISTEESYIGDVRFLKNIYSTIFATLPTASDSLRHMTNKSLSDIIELHDQLLGELHKAVPDAQYNRTDDSHSKHSVVVLGPCMAKATSHRRWASLDGLSRSPTPEGTSADAQVAGEVARVFTKIMNRFFVYKDYGSRYEAVLQDMRAMNNGKPAWNTYQSGLEALAAALKSFNCHKGASSRAMTVHDLLIKPIQRICKYPLLFGELLQCTPASDCPNSNMEIEDTLFRLRETTTAINGATCDDGLNHMLQRTWLVQDRLYFTNQRLDALSRSTIRGFGYLRLCGVLHICWQTQAAITGQYMICLLYDDIFCIASAAPFETVYRVRLCIPKVGMRVEGSEGERGLQCYSTPFSWKLVFESDHQLYEIIMTACNAKEESEWTRRLSQAQEHSAGADTCFTGSIDLEIKSRDTAARSATLQAAASPRFLSNRYVMLKNTAALGREISASDSPTTRIYRSRSLLTPAQMTVLAPAKADRARLESLVRDVWSRNTLPFPGMVMRSRSENIVRSSASSMIRKLSAAGIASSLSKRSGRAERDGAQSMADRGLLAMTTTLVKDDYDTDRSVKRQKLASTGCGQHAIVPLEEHDSLHRDAGSTSDKPFGRLLVGGVRLWSGSYNPLNLARYITAKGSGTDEVVQLPVARRLTFSERGPGHVLNKTSLHGLFP